MMDSRAVLDTTQNLTNSFQKHFLQSLCCLLMASNLGQATTNQSLHTGELQAENTDDAVNRLTLLMMRTLANVPRAMTSSFPRLLPYELKSFLSTPLDARNLAAALSCKTREVKRPKLAFGSGRHSRSLTETPDIT
jgi:hypothetical protein